MDTRQDYEYAFRRLRQIDRIDRLYTQAEEARSETMVLMKELLDHAKRDLERDFILTDDVLIAAKYALSKTYPWKFEDEFWRRHRLHREFDWVTWGGLNRWAPIQHTRRPANEVQDEIPF
ncbi:MAG TPA: hypothetical protein PLQ56_27695 [Aggregatilineales bacterium]|nr:hypothetical protein [Aggregatilineales bacterium]